VSARLKRRLLVAAGLAAPLAGWPAGADAVMPRRALSFPRDHGAHPDVRTEWWYATGWLSDLAGAPPRFGFQVTFFRSRTGLAQDNPSRFAARQLLFAHAAVSDLSASRLRHAQRIARWSGDPDAAASPRAAAAVHTTRVHLGAWRLARDDGGAYRAEVHDDGARFSLQLLLTPTQPLLLQGQAGWSAKGPGAEHASHYYSQPQLGVQGRLSQDGVTRSVQGRGWLDHEWSQALLPPGAVGWDWIGMNLDDGSALTAFQLRRADGSPVWAGGSFRAAGQAARIFANEEVQFTGSAPWTSPATRARYPTRWRIQTPVGTFDVQAQFEAQELDGGASTGAVYWEGLSSLKRGDQRVGWGYLEMTGYAAPLRL
jgi:predicted secreted hydrolase